MGRTVLGVTSENNSIMIRPALFEFTVMSKNTRGLVDEVMLKLEGEGREGKMGEMMRGNSERKESAGRARNE